MAASNLQKQASKDVPGGIPSKEECIYTSHYCEENIWMLVKKIQETTPENLPNCFVVFISNENKYIPLWRQSSSKHENGLVVWDYHVIMVYYNGIKSWVYDLDTQLSFPSQFSEYSKETFKSDDFLNPLCHRFYRVVPAESFLKYFSSDRRDMKNEDSSWKMPPPPYPPIRSCEDIHNLPHYTSMKASNDSGLISKFGNVFNLKDFIDRFTCKKSPEVNYMYPPDPLQPSWMA